MEHGDRLLFVPLGGTGEIGMNLNLYGLDGRWIMLDCGVTFADEHVPGVDLILPDPSFIAARRGSLEAIVLTHAHEDHLGAVAHLWRQLQCPIYATPFTSAILRRKLAETRLAEEVPLRTIPLGARFEVGPFDVEFVTVTHSILEPNAVVLRTRLGTVVHSGDFKIDPDPLIGDLTHRETLEAVGREGVVALICDSTNATRKGSSGSEGALRRSLDELIGSRRAGWQLRPSRRTPRASKRWPRWPIATVVMSRWSGAACGGLSRPRGRRVISLICHPSCPTGGRISATREDDADRYRLPGRTARSDVPNRFG